MSKVTRNPNNIKVKTGREMSRPKPHYGKKEKPQPAQDKTPVLKGKKAGEGLGDYTLDLMKLG